MLQSAQCFAMRLDCGFYRDLGSMMVMVSEFVCQFLKRPRISDGFEFDLQITEKRRCEQQFVKAEERL